MSSGAESQVERGLALPYQVARDHARQHGWREKVLAYVTFRSDELLVLEHTPGHVDAGTQVPAGGVEPGEEPSAAVVREVEEETGLRLSQPIYLASYEWPTPGAPSRTRHFFWLVAPAGTPDTWQHRVHGAGVDSGMLFRLSFVPRSDPGLVVGRGFESGLPGLSRSMSAR